MTKIILCGKILVGKKQNKKGLIEMELEELKKRIEAGGEFWTSTIIIKTVVEMIKPWREEAIICL